VNSFSLRQGIVKVKPVQEKSMDTRLRNGLWPDCRNSIKESISAVETSVRLITRKPKGTLGNLLRKWKDNLGLHQTQIDGWSALYGWTSAEGVESGTE